MDGGFNIFPHTHTHTTHTGARITQRELFASSSGTDLDGGGWGDGGGRAESTTMRCDANETCWGNTVLCILRCAFWNRNRFIHILDFFLLFFVFLGRFFLFLSECLFVPIRASQKRARTSITCIHHHHYHHHTGKGLGWGGEGWSNLCLFLVIWGKYRGLFPPSSRAGFLYSSLVVVFLQPTIPKPPCSISCQRDPHPRAPEAPGSLSHPPSSLLVKHAAGHAGTKGEERVVFSSEWFGRDGGVERGQGCVSMGSWEGGTSLQEKGKLPLPSQDKTFCRNFNVGMGVGGGGGGDWHGQAGRGATCMDLESREEVRDAYLRRTRSISPTGFVSLCLSLARRGWGERDGTTQDQVREKKKQRETAKPNIITPNR